MLMTKEQCRAARGLLGWSQEDLKKSANVARGTLADFERGVRTPYERTLRDLQKAMEEAGVEFMPENGNGAGVRFRKF